VSRDITTGAICLTHDRAGIPKSAVRYVDFPTQDAPLVKVQFTRRPLQSSERDRATAPGAIIVDSLEWLLAISRSPEIEAHRLTQRPGSLDLRKPCGKEGLDQCLRLVPGGEHALAMRLPLNGYSRSRIIAQLKRCCRDCLDHPSVKVVRLVKINFSRPSKVRARFLTRLQGCSIALVLLTGPAFLDSAVADDSSSIKVDTLLQTDSAWDGAPYANYPSGRPEISVLRITVPAHSVLPWHTHPMPNAGYVLSGTITVEKPDGEKRTVNAGDVLPETVGSVHRGVTGDSPVTLIVFYAGSKGMPLSQRR